MANCQRPPLLRPDRSPNAQSSWSVSSGRLNSDGGTLGAYDASPSPPPGNPSTPPQPSPISQSPAALATVEESTGSSGNSSPQSSSTCSPPKRPATRRLPSGAARQPALRPPKQLVPASPASGGAESPSSPVRSQLTTEPSRQGLPSPLHPAIRYPRPTAASNKSKAGPLHQPTRPARMAPPQRPASRPAGHVFRSAVSTQRQQNTGTPRQAFSSSSSPSSSTLRDTTNGHHTLSLVKGDQTWKTLPECSVQLFKLPQNFTTLNVYNLLKNEGCIVRISINRSKGDALVDFHPPPKRAFWNYPLRLPGSNEQLGLEYNCPRRSYLVPSPVNPQKLYPERITLPANGLDFGFMYDASCMMEMAKMTNVDDRGIDMTLNLERKEIDVQFTVGLNNSVTELPEIKYHRYRFRLPIVQVEQIFEIRAPGSENCELIIPFETPPALFKQTNDIASTHKDGKYWNEWQTWYRQTNVLHRQHNEVVNKNAVDLRNRHAVVDIGRWTIYRFVFDAQKNISSSKDYLVLCEALEDYNISVIKLERFGTKGKFEASFWNMLDSGYHQSLQSQSRLGSLDSSTISLDFAVLYQLEVCLSHGWLNEHNISRDFLLRLSSMDSDKARYILEKTADKQCRIYDPMEVFQVPVKGDAKIRVPKNCVYARSVTITPSMIYVNTPTVEISNRVVRYRIELQDRFVRVKFTDEKVEGRINSQDDDRFDEVFHRIKRAMTEGIIVGDRHYQFLAFGNSQFREHGAYFFSPIEGSNAEHDFGCTVESIREWMGEFRPIKSVSKYAARLGQCFSTSRAITAGKNVDLVEIQDIEHGGYNFTDGVGKISEFLALMVAHEFGLPTSSGQFPSLVQFRLGGCKGVLAVSSELKGNEIAIRPSQSKFVAKHHGLEIVRISSFATACLNRQLIIVLSTLGVSDRVFSEMQHRMLAELSRAMTDPGTARDKLMRNIDLNQMSLTLAGMVDDGFMGTKDPFMISVLHLWRSYTIKYLKEKARIMVEAGAFLLGCIDETNTLRGHYSKPQDKREATKVEKLSTLPEIFLQISDQDKKGSYKIIQGVCILARNPSLHPGDVRIVRAVDVPALHHLKNVVVLPQNGDRDIANMCSGGDLDGDDYLVIWDTALIPRTINSPAMNYEADPPREVLGDVTIAQVIDFYIKYMKNDSLGKIANAHLATADASPNGVLDDRCIQLAVLHSCAVDYPKNGNPARMSKDLYPKKYPHFMESKYRSKDKIYRSKKILGQLYDQVERADFTPFYENPFDARILNACQSDETAHSQAQKIKELYDADIRRIQAQHGIKTEFEVWTTFILEHNLESRDYTFTEEMGRISEAMKKKFQDMCIKAAGATNITDMQKLKPFVAAMYKVTADEMTKALEECRRTKQVGGKDVPMREMTVEQMPLMSFPWIFVSQLGEIANPTGLRAPLVPSQGIPYRVKKHPPVANLATGPSAVQTRHGTVHEGEMLILFDKGEEDSKDSETRVSEDEKHTTIVERGIRGTGMEAQQKKKLGDGTRGPNGNQVAANTKQWIADVGTDHIEEYKSTDEGAKASGSYADEMKDSDETVKENGKGQQDKDPEVEAVGAIGILKGNMMNFVDSRHATTSPQMGSYLSSLISEKHQEEQKETIRSKEAMDLNGTSENDVMASRLLKIRMALKEEVLKHSMAGRATDEKPPDSHHATASPQIDPKTTPDTSIGAQQWLLPALPVSSSDMAPAMSEDTSDEDDEREEVVIEMDEKPSALEALINLHS